MSDALATLFEDACPRARHVAVESDHWRLELDDGPALSVVVAVGGGALVSGQSGDRAVSAGEVIVVTGGAVSLHGDATAARPRHVFVGSYDVGGSVCDRALTGLPDVIVGSANAQTAALMAVLAEETEAVRAGRDAVVIRVLDLLAVTAIRDWMEAHPDVSPAWASAHKDPVVSRALELIHGAPDAAWTLESLAQQSRSSRSALSRRFSQALGESPMSYLTCWRLCLASDLLQKTDEPLAAVAKSVGYANPYAFSAAFHRNYGVRPGRYRSVSRASKAIRSPR